MAANAPPSAPITGPATLTHARLRAAQGDLRGAIRVVRALLARCPDDPSAQRLLAELAGPRREGGDEATARRPALVSPDRASPAAGASDRARRLRDWLQRIEQGR